MQYLSRNIIHLFGDSGKTWLSSLPAIIQTLSKHWQLTNLIPVTNMRYNYVTKAIANANQPVILKIGYDKKIINAEKNALSLFKSSAVVQMLDSYSKYNALLLQQALPGTLLKSYYPMQVEWVMDNYVQTMHAIHESALPEKTKFPHIKDRLKIIDKLTAKQVPNDLLKKTLYLKNELLNSIEKPVLLHGDLHQANILNDGTKWLAIDPYGVIGEAEFEVAAFDFIHSTEVANNLDLQKLFTSRIKLLAAKSQLNYERIKSWVLVRLMAAVATAIENKEDHSVMLKLAIKLTEQNQLSLKISEQKAYHS